MKSWRDTGPIVLEGIKKSLQELPASIAPELERMKGSFVMAAIRAFGREQNRDSLIEWLRSDRPITTDDRNALASILARPAPRPKRGAPANHDLHQAAFCAEIIYGAWKKLNKEKGIADFGHRSEMREEAIRMALEMGCYESIGFEQVLELTHRPKSRRK